MTARVGVTMTRRIVSCLAAAALVVGPIPAAGETVVWVRQFAIGEAASTSQIAVDATGVLVAGPTWSTFVGAPGEPDIFIRRYDLDGAEVSTQLIDHPGDAAFPTLALDATGVYVGATEIVEPDGEFNFTIRRFDTSGNELWSGSLPGQPTDLANVGDTLYVVGITLSGGARGYLRRYDSGVEQWTRHFWTKREGKGSRVAANETRVVVGTGELGVRAYDLDGTRLWIQRWRTQQSLYVAVGTHGVYAAAAVGRYPRDAVVRRFDLDGAPLWKRRVGTPRYEHVAGLIVDEAGVYVAGETSGTLAGQSEVGGRSDCFLVGWAPDGTRLWTSQFGTERTDRPSAVAMSPDGVFVAGHTTGRFDEGAGGADHFVLRMVSVA